MALANKYMDATKPYIVILRHRDSSILIVTDVNHPDSGERDVISFFYYLSDSRVLVDLLSSVATRKNLIL
jgi:hypothetical protein